MDSLYREFDYHESVSDARSDKKSAIEMKDAGTQALSESSDEDKKHFERKNDDTDETDDE